MKIIISNKSQKPIYEQILEQMRDLILTQELKSGEMLPSIRALAKDLKISVITTKRAYDELEREGLIVTIPSKGCYVAQKNEDYLKEEILRRIESSLNIAIDEARKINLSNEDITFMLETLLKEEKE